VIDISVVCRLLIEDPTGWVEVGDWKSEVGFLEHPLGFRIKCVGNGQVTINGWRLGWLSMKRLRWAFKKQQRNAVKVYLERKRQAELDAIEKEADRALTEREQRLLSEHEQNDPFAVFRDNDDRVRDGGVPGLRPGTGLAKPT
jgi:hypothetical protein